MTSIAALAALASTVLGEATASADPTTNECLAASDASLKSATEHKLREERAHLILCSSASCPALVQKECLSHVDEVNAQIPTIIFGAKDGGGADLTSVKVSIDGELLTDKLDGTAVSIDPGEHTFTFETAGVPPIVRKYVIEESQKARRETVTFDTLRPAPPPTVDPGLGTQRKVAIGVGALGIVGLGVGTALGLVALSEKSTAQGLCPMSACPTAEGVSKWQTVSSTATGSTIGFVVGGVAVAGAAVLWFTAPRARGTVSTQVGFGPGAVQWRGSW